MSFQSTFGAKPTKLEEELKPLDWGRSALIIQITFISFAGLQLCHWVKKYPNGMRN